MTNEDNIFEQESTLNEPLQDLSRENSESNKNIFIKNTTFTEPDDSGFSEQNSLETAEQEELDHVRPETTTSRPIKFDKLGKNRANREHPKLWMLLLLTYQLIIDRKL